jgi:hypothetical protein
MKVGALCEKHEAFLPVDLARDFVLMSDYTGKEVVE